MSTSLTIPSPSTALSSRADDVRAEILTLKTSMMELNLRLGRLLREARDNDYSLQWGYSRFGAWVEEASGLDMSERNAYYMIAVVERSEALGISDEQLHRVKFSKLKAILSLPADTDPDLVRSLVKDAEEASLKTVQEAVGIIKNEVYVFKTIKLERTVAENVWDPAIERARREYGDSIGFEGSIADIPESKAIELILADYNAGPDGYDDDDEILDAEFEDVLLPQVA